MEHHKTTMSKIYGGPVLLCAIARIEKPQPIVSCRGPKWVAEKLRGAPEVEERDQNGRRVNSMALLESEISSN